MLDGLHEEMVSAQKVVSELREAQEGKSLLVISVKLYIPYFFDQTPRLLFLLFVLCGYHLRVTTIQGRHFVFLESPQISTTA